jgi:DNA polymerase-3 subunit epsilon
MTHASSVLQLLAIDVETANRQDGRICQVGIASLAESGVAIVLDELINPKGHFAKEFTRDCHGITQEMVKHCVEFDGLYPKLKEILADRFVFSWHDFDSKQLSAACQRYALSPVPIVWLDACRAARRLWPHLGEYKLNVVAKHFGVALQHHNAASDASACMEIMRRAIEEYSFAEVVNAAFYRLHDAEGYWPGLGGLVDSHRTGGGRPKWRDRLSEDIERCGDENGRHFGKVVVLSGEFAMSREELADRAHAAGFGVKNGRSNVCKKTRYLVRGENAGMTKLNRAEELRASGQQIEILTEAEFMALLN